MSVAAARRASVVFDDVMTASDLPWEDSVEAVLVASSKGGAERPSRPLTRGALGVALRGDGDRGETRGG